MSGTHEEDNKQGEQPTHVVLKVLGQDGDKVVVFRMKRSAKFKKLMKAYSDRKYVDFRSIVFLFYARQLRSDHTPDELEMKDGDEINAFFRLPRKTEVTDSS